jgi:calcineurin-like phosphoesterase family protein
LVERGHALNFQHEKVIQFCNRPFASIQEHDEALISNWNSVVGKKDFVLLLGDFCFDWGKYSDLQKADYFIRRLQGRIIFLRGNHDRNIHKYKNLFYFYTENGIHDFKLNGVKYSLSHFPLLDWGQRWHGGISFHGHTHAGSATTSLAKTLPFQRNSLDVGVDNCNYYPILLENAIERARKTGEDPPTISDFEEDAGYESE